MHPELHFNENSVALNIVEYNRTNSLKFVHQYSMRSHVSHNKPLYLSRIEDCEVYIERATIRECAPEHY